MPEGWTQRQEFQDWFIDDPKGQPVETFRRVREEIRGRVTELLQALAHGPQPV